MDREQGDAVSGIVEFVRARLNEDERDCVDQAVAIGEDVDSARVPGWYAAICSLDGCEWSTSGRQGVVEEAAYEHVTVTHADVPVLRRVEALRSLVAWCDEDPLCHDGGWAYTDRVFRGLASIWSTHPNYDPSWGTR